MNLIRWILGIPVAFMLSIGILLFFSITMDKSNLYSYGNPYIFLAIHSTKLTVGFSLFIFLSCLFLPSNRRYGLLISNIIGILFIGILIFLKFYYGTH